MDDLSNVIGNLHDRIDSTDNSDVEFGDAANTANLLPVVTDLQGTASYYVLPLVHTQKAKIVWTWTTPVMYDEDNNPVDPNDPGVQDSFDYDPVVDYMFGYSVNNSKIEFTTTRNVLTVTTEGHELGHNVTGHIYAVTLSGLSGPIASTTVTVNKDTTPPPKPSLPALTSMAGIVSVIWDGKDYTGAAMPDDTKGVVVRMGTSPTPTKQVGMLFGAGTLSVGAATNTLQYVTLTAVDYAENYSSATTAVSITVKSILDDTDLDQVLSNRTRLIASATTPPGIDYNENDLWLDPTDDTLYTWDGSNWIFFVANAATLLAAESVVTNNLSADAITAPKIASDAIISRHIKAGEVLADKIGAGLLTALITLSGIIQTSSDGARVVLDSTGVTLFDANNSPITYIGTDGENFFSGNLVANHISIEGSSSFTSKDNFIEPGSEIVLRAGIQQPGTQAVISNYYPTIIFSDRGASLKQVKSVGRMTTGEFVVLSDNNKLSVHNATTGSWLRDTRVTTSPSSPYDMVVVNNYAILIYWDSSYPRYILRSYNLTTWVSSVDSGAFGNYFVNVPALIPDNNIRCITYDNFNPGTSARIHTFTWVGDTFSTTVATKSFANILNAGHTPLARNNFDLGVDTVLSAQLLPNQIKAQINAWNYSNVTANSNANFTAATATCKGLGYYNSAIWIAHNDNVKIYNGLNWSGAVSRNYDGTYAYYDDVNNYKSKVATKVTGTINKRAALKINVPGWAPSVEIPKVRFYVAQAGNTLYAQGSNALGNLNISSLATSGDVPSSSSTFPGTTPGLIRSDNSGIVIRADNTYILPPKLGAKAIRTSDGPTVTSSTWTKMSGLTSVYDDANIINVSTGVITIPETGRWEISFFVPWRSYGTAYRRIILISKSATVETQAIKNVQSTGTGRWYFEVSVKDNFNAGDQFTCWMWSDTTSNGPYPSESNNVAPSSIEVQQI